MISIPYPGISCFTAAHTYIIPIMAVPPPPWESKLLQVTHQNAMIDWTPMGQVCGWGMSGLLKLSENKWKI